MIIFKFCLVIQEEHYRIHVNTSRHRELNSDYEYTTDIGNEERERGNKYK
jgi:hypothetical protein